MMDLRTIAAMAGQASRKAARTGREPYAFFDLLDVAEAAKSLPFLGPYTPKGYRLHADMLVDSSGVSAPGKPALTFEAFVAHVRADIADGNRYHYAIRQAGEFQVHVGVYERDAKRVRRASRTTRLTSRV
jgi:hypothetical protein